LPTNANEVSAPLSNVPYEEQIRLKQENAKKVAQMLIKQLSEAKVANARYIKADKLLQEVCILCPRTNYLIF
jgi:hypothetical protein